MAFSYTEAEYILAANVYQEVKLEKIKTRTERIAVRYHFLRDAVEQNVIMLGFCETDKMIADTMFTRLT